jgi:hypothetical protein
MNCGIIYGQKFPTHSFGSDRRNGPPALGIHKESTRDMNSKHHKFNLSMTASGWGEEGRGLTNCSMGMGFSWGDENVWGLDSCVVCIKLLM